MAVRLLGMKETIRLAARIVHVQITGVRHRRAGKRARAIGASLVRHTVTADQRVQAVGARVTDADLHLIVAFFDAAGRGSSESGVGRTQTRRVLDTIARAGRGQRARAAVRVMTNRGAATAMNSQRETRLVETVAHRFRRPEALVDGPRRLHGRSIDFPVEKQHHEHGYVERAERRVNDVAGVVGHLAHQRTRR